MIIKSVYPVLITRDVQKALDIFTETGFKVLHRIDGIFGSENVSYVLGNELNERVDIIYSKNEDDKERHSIRMNVDNLEDAIEQFAKYGYKTIHGPYENDSMKCVVLESSEHFTLMVVEHKRKDDND